MPPVVLTDKLRHADWQVELRVKTALAIPINCLRFSLKISILRPRIPFSRFRAKKIFNWITLNDSIVSHLSVMKLKL